MEYVSQKMAPHCRCFSHTNPAFSSTIFGETFEKLNTRIVLDCRRVMEKFIVSARKYRPQTFDTVVGQDHITTTLKNAIRSGHLAHAFLFCGPRGVGKTTCARILAKTINCEHPSKDG